MYCDVGFCVLLCAGSPAAASEPRSNTSTPDSGMGLDTIMRTHDHMHGQLMHNVWVSVNVMLVMYSCIFALTHFWICVCIISYTTIALWNPLYSYQETREAIPPQQAEPDTTIC